jgi:hypothetical protein
MNEYDEILDVVNLEDNVVGKASRLQVHNNELMHRSAHILVFNTSGDLFIQKRAMIKDESPGLWDSSAAGHDESGENYISSNHNQPISIIAAEPIDSITLEGLQYTMKDEKLLPSAKAICNKAIGDQFYLNATGKVFVFLNHID